MRVGAIEALNIEANFSAGIIWIGNLTHKLVIEMKEEIGTLGIHSQEIINIQVLNAFLNTF